MAVNRSIHCVFRYASSPYILGSAPFTNATFKRYYSVQKCSNKARFDILRHHQITSSASTLLLSRTKSTSTGVDEILSKAASEISKDGSIIKDVHLKDMMPELTDVTAHLNALGEESLKSLGLAKMTPIGIIQQILEMIHVNLDVPWIGAIAIYTVIIRLLLTPMYVKSRQASVKTSNHHEVTSALYEKIRRATLKGDDLTAREYKAELKEYQARHGIQTYKQFLPLLVQSAVFIPTFMGLRGMAELPVESMKTGGILWFQDLAQADPYYGLAALTSLTLATIVRVGAENPNTTAIARKTGMVLSGISFLFVMNFPAALGCYWVTTNFISLFQAFLFTLKPVKKFFNIPEIVQVTPQNNKGNKSLREIYQDLKEDSARKSKMSNEEALRDFERIHAIEMEKAGKGPIPVTYKNNPKLKKKKQLDRQSVKL